MARRRRDCIVVVLPVGKGGSGRCCCEPALLLSDRQRYASPDHCHPSPPDTDIEQFSQRLLFAWALFRRASEVAGAIVADLVLCLPSSTLPKKVRRSVQPFRQSSLRLFLLLPPLHLFLSSASIFPLLLHFINSIKFHHSHCLLYQDCFHTPARIAHFVGITLLACRKRVISHPARCDKLNPTFPGHPQHG